MIERSGTMKLASFRTVRYDQAALMQPRQAAKFNQVKAMAKKFAELERKIGKLKAQAKRDPSTTTECELKIKKLSGLMERYHVFGVVILKTAPAYDLKDRVYSL